MAAFACDIALPFGCASIPKVSFSGKRVIQQAEAWLRIPTNVTEKVVLHDLVLWPGSLSAVFPRLVHGLNDFTGPCQAAGDPRQGLTQSLSAVLMPIDF